MPRRLLQLLVVAGAVGLGAVHAVLVLDFKAWLDRGAALCEVSERALRAGQLRPAELGFAPFGFAGWQLYPYFIAHEGRDTPQIDGFNLYLRPEAVLIGQHYSRFLRRFARFNFVAPTDRRGLIAIGHTRCLWRYRADYYLLRNRSAPAATVPWVLGTDFQRPWFPLTDAEWRTLIFPRHAAVSGVTSGSRNPPPEPD